MKKTPLKIFSLLNKHYNILREAHPKNYLVENWIDHCISETHKNKELFICSRVYIHWSEGDTSRLKDGQIFKSFFDFRAELIKRDLQNMQKRGACGGYDKVKFSVVGLRIKPNEKEIQPVILTDRVDLGDGKYGIDKNIDVLDWFREREICIVPTTYDLQNIDC